MTLFGEGGPVTFGDLVWEGWLRGRGKTTCTT